MSQTANLYVVPEAAVEEIQKATVPQKTGWFRKPEDKFWQTLWAHAGRDRLHFEWSGYAFVVLLEYLRDRKHFDIESPEKSELAAFLSKVRQSYFLTFTPAQAGELARKLAELPAEDDDIAQYVTGFCGPQDRETMVTAVRAAARTLPQALEGVQSGSIGLMSIG